LVLAVLSTASLGAQEVARVQSVSGEVELKKAGAAEYTAVEAGTALGLGDQLVTDVESEAVLKFPQGAEVRVYELSQVRVNEMFVTPDAARLQMFLRTGKVETMTPERSLLRTGFTVKTPVATASIRGSHQLVSHTDVTGTDVFFVRGTGSTRSDNGKTVNQSGGSSSTVHSGSQGQGNTSVAGSSSSQLQGNTAVALNNTRLGSHLPGLTPAEQQAALEHALTSGQMFHSQASPSNMSRLAVETPGSPRFLLTIQVVP
jgi:hypothetical protein